MQGVKKTRRWTICSSFHSNIFDPPYGRYTRGFRYFSIDGSTEILPQCYATSRSRQYYKKVHPNLTEVPTFLEQKFSLVHEMPIKYIGRTHTFKGLPLWEILGNLKNHGVGRMVIRSKQQRYPEASYMRILKVAALPDTSKHIHDPRNVMVLVEQTFRGKTWPEPVQLDMTTYKPDYVLIHKDQEASYISRTEQPGQKILPQTTDFPPLLKEILVREATQQGKNASDLKLKLLYNLTGFKNYRVARDDETPTVKITMGLGDPISPSLYANVKVQRTS